MTEARIAIDDRRAIAAAVDSRLQAVDRAVSEATAKAEATRRNLLGRDESAQVRKAVAGIRDDLAAMRRLGERIKAGEFSANPQLLTDKFNYLVGWARAELVNLPGIGRDADELGLTKAVFYTVNETTKQVVVGVADTAKGLWNAKGLILGGVVLVLLAVLVIKVRG